MQAVPSAALLPFPHILTFPMSRPERTQQTTPNYLQSSLMLRRPQRSRDGPIAVGFRAAASNAVSS